MTKTEADSQLNSAYKTTMGLLPQAHYFLQNLKQEFEYI